MASQVRFLKISFLILVLSSTIAVLSFIWLALIAPEVIRGGGGGEGGP